MSKLEPQQVQELLKRKQAAGLSPRTVAYIRAVLRQALNQALRWGLVARNVAALVEPPKVERAEIRPWTREEAQRFLDHARGDRLGALFSVALALGLRKGEALGLQWDDADLDAAVKGAIVSKFRNNGQTCVCANRIYVQSGVYDAFASKLAEAVGRMRVGDGLAQGIDLGPLISPSAADKVREHIEDAVAKGARVLTGGHGHPLGGSFFEPTIVAGATREMAVAHEETFGPFAPLFRFEDEADVIAQANDTIFGLACYFYARDLSRVIRVQEALEYGMVGINTGLISTEVAPFGGVKQSGLGREGSRHGIEDYLEIKYLCMSI